MWLIERLNRRGLLGTDGLKTAEGRREGASTSKKGRQRSANDTQIHRTCSRKLSRT